MNLYIRTSKGKTDASLVSSPDIGAPPMEFPDLPVGDTIPLSLYFIDDDGNYETWSGQVGYTPSVQVGTLDEDLTGGTFTLTHDSNSTSALAYNATAATVEAALNALASIIAEGYVDVYGESPNYRVIWRLKGAVASISGNGDALTPAGVCGCTVLVVGTVDYQQEMLIKLQPNQISTQTAWTQTTDTYGWTGYVSLRTFGAFQFIDGYSNRTGNVDIEILDGSGMVRTWLTMECIVRNRVLSNDTALEVNPPISYSETDPIFTSHVAYTITALWIGNWTTAYGWGDHSLVGYCTITIADARYLKLTGGTLTGSLGIYGSADASAALEIESTTKGFLPPRMTRVQRDAIISPATNLFVYQTDEVPGLYMYTGATWINTNQSLYCADDGKFYPLVVNLMNGEPVLGIGNALT